MLESDQQLIDAIAAGDADALESVYRSHKDRLLTATALLMRGLRPAAEDVLHDVFIQLVEQSHTLRLRSSLQGYLMTCCLNRARDFLRRQGIQKKAQEKCVSEMSSSDDPSQFPEDREENERTLRLVAMLPDDQREVLTLHIHGEMTFANIADVLGISVNTAKSRYRYALEKLRQKWPGHSIEKGGL